MINTCLVGDCRSKLKEISDGSVQCCITSPPYWNLRDYGHDDQIGLEPSPAEYVAQMVEVFREVRRVLADDGVLWLNLGDSYATAQLKSSNIKHKDLIGIPWMVAFALRYDGWYLRQDVIWSKPNPMPESITDRCTKSHEYVFMMTKSARYFYDQESIKEDLKHPAAMVSSGFGGHKKSGGATYSGSTYDASALNGKNKRSVWTLSKSNFTGSHCAVMPEKLVETCVLAGSKVGDTVLDPFFGSGTVGQVSERLGRNWIGVELNTDYLELQSERTSQRGLGI